MSYSKDIIKQELKKRLIKNRVPNVLICGKNGVGKTSIIDFALKIQAIENKFEQNYEGIIYTQNEYINFYETNTNLDLIKKFLTKNNAIVWYVIPANETNIDNDITTIKEIRCQKKEISVVVSKIDNVSENELQIINDKIEQNLPYITIHKLSSFDTTDIYDGSNWNKLKTWTFSLWQELIKNTYIKEIQNSNNIPNIRKKIIIYIIATSITFLIAYGFYKYNKSAKIDTKNEYSEQK